MNVAIVRGRLSSAPRATELGSGDVAVRYEVTVPRPGGGRADSVPVSWTGPAKQLPAATNLDAGAEVVAVGRVQRRWYRPSSGSSRSTTEVAADAVVPASNRRRVATVLDRARTVLDDDTG